MGPPRGIDTVTHHTISGCSYSGAKSHSSYDMDSLFLQIFLVQYLIPLERYFLYICKLNIANSGGNETLKLEKNNASC